MFFIPKNVTKLPVVNTVKRMLIVIVTTFIIWLPSFTIDISPNGYIQWVINAVQWNLCMCCCINKYHI